MKKQFKFHIGLLLAAVLLFSLLASCGNISYAEVSQGNKSGNFVYTLYENGTAVITGGSATDDGQLIIPESLDGNKVSAIASEAFKEQTDFYYLQINGTGISLGSNCFYGCAALTVADIPGVSEISNGAFYLCSNLTYVKTGEKLESIGSVAFCGCSSLAVFTFGKGLVSIGNSAFEGCSTLSSVELPSSLKNLGESVFSGCSSLAYADISYVKEVPAYAFVQCSNLSRIIFSSKLESIGEQAFRSCTSLCTLTLPKSLKNISDSAFGACSALDTVNYTGSEGAFKKIATESGNEVLTSLRPYCNYKESKNSTDKYTVYYGHGTASGSFASEGYTYSLFDDGCAMITGFSGSITALDIPESLDGHTVVSIGEAAFSENTGLTSLFIPDSVEEICAAAFYNDTALLTVSGGKKLKFIGNRAFDGTAFVSSFSGDYVSLGPVLITYRGSCSSVIVPSGIGYIGEGAFSNDLSITCADLGDSVVSLGAQAFAYCEKLSCVLAPALKYIGDNAFTSCESLTAADMGNPESIGEYAFADCNSLRYVCTGNCIESLSGYVYYSCINLRVFCMPISLTTLNADCFNDGTPFVVLYPGTNEEYLSAITGEGTQNLSDMFIISGRKE